MEIKLKAYAKINLFLDIIGKMQNGFHEIESLMQTVSLADEISLQVEKTEITQIDVICASTYAPSGQDNIVHRAVEEYLKRAGENATVRVELVKNIPSPAGMGGGSSDAAAVLRGLNEIFGAFDIQNLLGIAAEIGSDVPFCICGGTAVAEGRGEKLKQLEPLADCFIVIGCGSDKMPTPHAFRLLDEKYNDFRNRDQSRRDDAHAIDNVENVAVSLYNIFEDVMIDECPSVFSIKRQMLDGGALGALMSGSGPSVFGIFDNSSKALVVADKIKKNGDFSAVCTPIKKYL